MAVEETELESLRRLVAFYQSEGEDEIPEEREWKSLTGVPPKKRTEEQSRRLMVLAELIPKLCSSRELRNRVKLAWNRKTICPECGVSLVTDFHLETCAIGIIVENGRQHERS